MITLPLLACIALLAAVLTGGCGSSDEPESTQAETTQAETTPSGESDVLDRLPEVPEATESTRPPESPDGTGGSAFLRDVFDDVQEMGRREFEAAGARYTPATLTIFRDEVHTGCGTESAKTGPFYCPADHGVYLDTRFFDALARTAGVELGDFAQAYVVAHEVAHHVQTLLGILQRVRGLDETDPAGSSPSPARGTHCALRPWSAATSSS